MSQIPKGADDRQGLYVVARRVLLDALVALRDQDEAITIVGAQAIYLRSVDVELSVASYTSDADLGQQPCWLQRRTRFTTALTSHRSPGSTTRTPATSSA